MDWEVFPGTEQGDEVVGDGRNDESIMREAFQSYTGAVGVLLAEGHPGDCVG